MSLPEIVSEEEWRAARTELLQEEKAMTRARDALSARRLVRVLDLTALGRQEDWEEPKGRAATARAAVPDFSEE